MLNLGQVTFRYEPFPIGVAPNVIPSGDYEELVSTFPDLDQFQHRPNLGNHYMMSPPEVQSYCSSRPLWREYLSWIKSDAFIQHVFETLHTHHIELGYQQERSLPERFKYYLRCMSRGFFPLLRKRLYVDVSFVRIPVQGGFLLPHTDRPGKILNIPTTIILPDEWDASYGGGTDINWPKDRTRAFNYANKRFEFDEVDVLDSIPYRPNQSLIVIKSWNSWHSIRTMTGNGTNATRNTLNINICDRLLEI